MEDSKGFLMTSDNNKHRVSIVIEDNGRVCYAYLYSFDKKIIGDVWLYNRCDAPEVPEWTNKYNAPFANPAKYARRELPFLIPKSPDDFHVRWLEKNGEPEAHIFIGQILVGIVTEGSKPGFSVAAARSGPLAKALENDVALE